MNIEPFANKLEADGVGVVGTDIFLYRLPDRVVEGIVFVQPLSGAKIDHELVNYYRSKFQVIIRAKRFETGLTLTESVVQSLTAYDVDLDNYKVKYVRPRTEYVSYPVSEGNHIEFSLNFETAFVKT